MKVGLEPTDGSGIRTRDGAKMRSTRLLKRCRGAAQDGANGRDDMGDKGGKKDKEKDRKQSSVKQQQKDKARQDKQPKGKVG